MTEPILNPDALEVAPGTIQERLQGWVPDLASEDELRLALDKALDYRGDVTVTCRDGRVLDGYIYDCRKGRTLADSLVRMLPSDGSARISIPYSDIAALKFSYRDPAAGKSWEGWVRKYWEKKSAGQKAEIKPESLD
jgi:hypothetical protein